MKKISIYTIFLILFYISICVFSFGIEDMTKYKGKELADKLYANLQVKSYQLIIEYINSLGDVRQINCLFLEPNYLIEEMNVTSTKNQALKDESLKVVCDGSFLWITLKSISVDLFQYIDIQKVKDKGIEIKDFFRSYSMGNLYSYSNIFKNKRVIPESWEIIGKKEINGKECYEIKFQYQKKKDKKIAEDKILVGCEDGIPRFPGVRILSYLPYAPLKPQNFVVLPPKNTAPKDATKAAIQMYLTSKEQDSQDDKIAKFPASDAVSKTDKKPEQTPKKE